MLEKSQFEDWINASHTLYEIFELRYDVYPLAKKWVQQWLSFDKFIIEKKEIMRVETLVDNFDINAFRNFYDNFEKDEMKWRKFTTKVNEQIINFVKNQIVTGESEDIGKAVSLYLLTWNFQRFKEYFKYKEDFNLEQYFNKLHIFLERIRAL